MVDGLQKITISDDKNKPLRFDGSIWCNLDIALRNLDQIYAGVVGSLNLNVIEWYILRALYEQDGVIASELARAVGRAPTSFTPLLDKLQNKDLIERKPDHSDRRAVRIYLTPKANEYRDQVVESAEEIDARLQKLLSSGESKAFQKVIAILQALSINAN